MGGPVTKTDNMGLTWENRFALWLPRPPVLGAVLFATFLIGLLLSFNWYQDFPFHRLPVLIILMVAYIMMAPRLFAYRLALDRKQFGLEVPVLGRREMEVWILSLPRDKIRRSRLTGLAGALILFGFDTWIAYLENEEFGPLSMWFQIHTGTTTLIACTIIGWLMGRAIYLSVVCPFALPFPRPGEIDLLNLDKLYAIGRSGLREALLWLVGMSIGSLALLDTVFGLWGVFPLFGFGLVLGLRVLLKPARKVRNLIQNAKREELARLEPQLKQARDDAMTDDASTQGRLTDLLAYQDRVKSTPEWPFDSTTLMRFGLYLLIPVGSMIGGALVERVVNSMLD